MKIPRRILALVVLLLLPSLSFGEDGRDRGSRTRGSDARTRVERDRSTPSRGVDRPTFRPSSPRTGTDRASVFGDRTSTPARPPVRTVEPSRDRTIRPGSGTIPSSGYRSGGSLFGDRTSRTAPAIPDRRTIDRTPLDRTPVRPGVVTDRPAAPRTSVPRTATPSDRRPEDRTPAAPPVGTAPGFRGTDRTPDREPVRVAPEARPTDRAPIRTAPGFRTGDRTTDRAPVRTLPERTDRLPTRTDRVPADAPSRTAPGFRGGDRGAERVPDRSPALSGDYRRADLSRHGFTRRDGDDDRRGFDRDRSDFDRRDFDRRDWFDRDDKKDWHRTKFRDGGHRDWDHHDRDRWHVSFYLGFSWQWYFGHTYVRASYGHHWWPFWYEAPVCVAYVPFGFYVDRDPIIIRETVIVESDPIIIEKEVPVVVPERLDAPAPAEGAAPGEAAAQEPPPPLFDATTEKYLREGSEAFASADYFAAAEAFRMAVVANPDAASPKFALGQALVALGDYPYAARVLREAIAAEPDILNAPGSIVGVYQAPEEFYRVLSKLKAKRQADPLNADLTFLVVYQHYFSGDPQAVVYHAQLAKAHPADPMAVLFGPKLAERFPEFAKFPAPKPAPADAGEPAAPADELPK